VKPNVQRSDPPYVQVARHIRQQIVDGTFADGDMIPSARQIASEWGLSLATATKVLAALRADGLVRAVPGVGTVVTARELLRDATKNRLVSVRRGGRIYAAGEHAKILSAEIVRAPNPVADALGLRPGARVIRRHRVRYRGEEPVSSSTSWFSASLAKPAPALLETGRVRQGTAEYIGEQTGRYVKSGQDQLAASTASTEVASELGIEPGSPVLLSRHWMYDEDSNVVEYGESQALPDRWASYEYEVAR
jgi:DNA-binding GntR family transcriptional regulator